MSLDPMLARWLQQPTTVSSSSATPSNALVTSNMPARQEHVIRQLKPATVTPAASSPSPSSTTTMTQPSDEFDAEAFVSSLHTDLNYLNDQVPQQQRRLALSRLMQRLRVNQPAYDDAIDQACTRNNPAFPLAWLIPGSSIANDAPDAFNGEAAAEIYTRLFTLNDLQQVSLAHTLASLPVATTTATTTSTPAIPAHTRDAAYTLCMKPLLKRVCDSVEKCRELASILLLDACATVSFPTLVEHLPFLVPVLSYRLNHRDLSAAFRTPDGRSSSTLTLASFPVHTAAAAGDDADGAAAGGGTAAGKASSSEPSEEIRLRLFACVITLLQRCMEEHVRFMRQPSSSTSTSSFSSSHPQLHQRSLHHDPILSLHMSEFVSILAQGALDRHPHAKCLAVSVLSPLARVYPLLLRSVSTLLCRLCMLNALHKHAKVRAAVVDALRFLVPAGATECVRELCAFREANVVDVHGFYHGEARVNYLAHGIQDSNVHVRHAWFLCLADWMTTMRERTDYETLLTPFVLASLNDEHVPVQQLGLRACERIGRQYEYDWEDRLRDEHDYGSAAEALLSRMEVGAAPQVLLTCPPFETRPSLGARHYFRKFLERLLPAILNEVQDFKLKDAQQLHALRLLRCLMFFAEDHVVPYTAKIWRSFALLLCAVRREEHREWKERPRDMRDFRSPHAASLALVRDCCAFLGRYARADVLVDLVLEQVDARLDVRVLDGDTDVAVQPSADAAGTLMLESLALLTFALPSMPGRVAARALPTLLHVYRAVHPNVQHVVHEDALVVQLDFWRALVNVEVEVPSFCALRSDAWSAWSSHVRPSLEWSKQRMAMKQEMTKNKTTSAEEEKENNNATDDDALESGSTTATASHAPFPLFKYSAHDLLARVHTIDQQMRA